MDSAVLSCKGCTSWQETLATGVAVVVVVPSQETSSVPNTSIRSLLGYTKHLTSSQLTNELVPLMVDEGDKVLLLVHDLPEKLQGLAWHKGVLPFGHLKIANHAVFAVFTKSSILEHAYYGRATIRTDGSLLFWNVTRKDTGLTPYEPYLQTSADLKSEWVIMHFQVNRK
ncbi:carcinoembryonic antigen-related cell adhesion molecule 3-like [Psammomys obesus]|uniref:carcinoembryonic antigen-related cell adhesion molecule 3-like n=1 Tax=Psammomys obesus TaxID=48139 RepID=UPI002452D1A6|nr:carcinoembryonic antigen-related cell adhesion molecule 3-like [Psammomys obesus]